MTVSESASLAFLLVGSSGIQWQHQLSSEKQVHIGVHIWDVAGPTWLRAVVHRTPASEMGK